MNIAYNEEKRIFRLDTKNTSYLMGITDKEGFLGHIYYGKRLEEDNVGYLLRTWRPITENGFPLWRLIPQNIPPMERGITDRTA